MNELDLSCTDELKIDGLGEIMDSLGAGYDM